MSGVSASQRATHVPTDIIANDAKAGDFGVLLHCATQRALRVFGHLKPTNSHPPIRDGGGKRVRAHRSTESASSRMMILYGGTGCPLMARSAQR